MVSGILSNTDDSTPSAATDCQLGSGRLSTGISDAAATSNTRNKAPFAAGFTTDQSGWPIGPVTRIAAQIAIPSQGRDSPTPVAFAQMFVATAATRMKATIPIRRQSSGCPAGLWARIG